MFATINSVAGTATRFTEGVDTELDTDIQTNIVAVLLQSGAVLHRVLTPLSSFAIYEGSREDRDCRGSLTLRTKYLDDGLEDGSIKLLWPA